MCVSSTADSKLKSACPRLFGVQTKQVYALNPLHAVVMMDAVELEKQTVKELKELCRGRGFKLTGVKTDLVARLLPGAIPAPGRGSNAGAATAPKAAAAPKAPKVIEGIDQVRMYV